MRGLPAHPDVTSPKGGDGSDAPRGQILGPLPRTQRGNRFILTTCDYATRYPDVIALPSTDACWVARELVAFFARVGIPEEFLTDQGSNFMSALLGEVFTHLQGAGLTVKIKKCLFGWPIVPYLGHLVGGGDLEPDPGKVQAVKEYPNQK